MTEVFLDTSYAIALSAISDDFHDQAVEIAYQVEREKTCLVTIQAILLEIGIWVFQRVCALELRVAINSVVRVWMLRSC